MKKSLCIFCISVLFFSIISCNTGLTGDNNNQNQTTNSTIGKLGLKGFEADVINGVPTSMKMKMKMKTIPIDGRVGTNAPNSWGLGNEIAKLLVDPSEAGNIVREVQTLDSYISNLNEMVNCSNQSVNSSITVSPILGGTVTLPFFNQTVKMDYKVAINNGNWGWVYYGYKNAANYQAITVFNSYTMNNVKEYCIFYGVRSNNVVIIKSAVMGIKTNDGSLEKGWSFSITLYTNSFEVDQRSQYMCHRLVGDPRGYFLFRGIETTNAAGILDLSQKWFFNGANFTADTNIYKAYMEGSEGGTVTTNDMTNKPATIAAGRWFEMVSYLGGIGDPDARDANIPSPISTNSFNESYLK